MERLHVLLTSWRAACSSRCLRTRLTRRSRDCFIRVFKGHLVRRWACVCRPARMVIFVGDAIESRDLTKQPCLYEANSTGREDWQEVPPDPVRPTSWSAHAWVESIAVLGLTGWAWTDAQGSGPSWRGLQDTPCRESYAWARKGAQNYVRTLIPRPTVPPNSASFCLRTCYSSLLIQDTRVALLPSSWSYWHLMVDKPRHR